ncbi:flavodoxin [Brachyspira pilosicoli]|uniref:Flavodoxin n=1 Tax=Brachyspira pilosicoli (strain ATCC BAA-1826 / 95/1000) TaxID=759914 RepID=D8IBT3_BRAP9|nr:flavodoxin [Brachyspira pilosicoli]ADK30606.1 flavodoxin [Brachyspira pilosicoli 95/1000]
MNVFIKKIIFVLLSIIMLSCTNNDTQKKDYIVDSLETSQNINALNVSNTQNKILIAYFTWSDNTVVENPDSIDVDAETSASVLSPGNAELIANWIAEKTGGDLFSIKTQNKYSSDYDECLNQARKERDNNERPALVGRVNNIDDYDVIFLGFPNWWYTCPMAVFTFVESYDLEGKTIIPFCTHGTGGLSRTIRDLKNILPENCEVLEAIGVYRPEVKNSKSRVLDWLRKLGY